MRRNRNTPAASANNSASASVVAPAARPVLSGLRLCGTFEPCSKAKPTHGRPAALVFSDPGAHFGAATMMGSPGLDDSDSPGNPAERTVLVNLAPYLTTASNQGAHNQASGHPSHSDPLFAEISAVLDTMQSSIDSLKDDVDSFKFPTEGSFSGPTRPAA